MAVVSSIIALAFVAFIVLMLVGGWRMGRNEADANRYLAEQWRKERRRRY